MHLARHVIEVGLPGPRGQPYGAGLLLPRVLLSAGRCGGPRPTKTKPRAMPDGKKCTSGVSAPSPRLSTPTMGPGQARSPSRAVGQ